eukprot:157627_1
MTLSATASNATFCLKEGLVVNGFVYHQNIPYHKKHRKPTMFNESDILSDSEKKELKQLISTTLYMRDIPFTTTELIFNSQIHGFTHKSFYKQCSNKSNTLILIEAHPTSHNNYDENKIIFGGFTTKKWTINGQHVEDENAFLYRLRANEFGSSVFPIEKYKQFAVYQSPPPDPNDISDNILFYFGQPVSLLVSENANKNFNSYVSGGPKSNYNIPYKGSIIGLPNTQLMCCFKVRNFEVFQIK